MNIADIARYRLHNQQIASQKHQTIAQTVAWLGAIQAQDYPGAKWSTGLRVPGTSDADVEQAVADRLIVRTWPMRGTLHMIAAQDVRWMLELLTPRIIAGSRRRSEELELDAAVLNRCRMLFAKILQGGKLLTRDEMYAFLEAENISTAAQRGYHILWRTAQEGLICFGPLKGKQQTFALLDDWIPQTDRAFERNQALAELAKRYFASHGPATLQDFVWWSGLKMTEARSGIEAIEPQFRKETVDEKTYWMPLDTHTDAPPQDVYLLPGFDEYLLGYTDRSAVLEAQYAKRICPGGNGMFSPTVVRNGQVIGTWKRVLKKNAAAMTACAFTQFGKGERDAIVTAMEHYGQFMQMPVSIAFEG